MGYEAGYCFVGQKWQKFKNFVGRGKPGKGEINPLGRDESFSSLKAGEDEGLQLGHRLNRGWTF